MVGMIDVEVQAAALGAAARAFDDQVRHERDPFVTDQVKVEHSGASGFAPRIDAIDADRVVVEVSSGPVAVRGSRITRGESPCVSTIGLTPDDSSRPR